MMVVVNEDLKVRVGRELAWPSVGSHGSDMRSKMQKNAGLFTVCGMNVVWWIVIKVKFL